MAAMANRPCAVVTARARCRAAALLLAITLGWALGAQGCLAVSSRTLQEGMWGEDVRALQEVLRLVGFSHLNADGYFGPDTARGVRAVQEALGIQADGIVGATTRQVFAALATPYRYSVVEGDTLWDVARRFGASMEEIMDANGMHDTRLVPGNSLVIPSVRRLFVPTSMQVRQIAARLSVPAEALAQLNGLKSTDTIRSGSMVWTPLPRVSP